MTSICLSLVPILRCESLTWFQYLAILIPPGLEVVLCVALMVTMWTSHDIKHLFLAAEGLTYFILTLLDFVILIVPSVRSSVHLFKVLDIVLGSLSFSPLLLYTFFLFLVAQSELLQALPARFQGIIKCTLLVQIPMIIAGNALGSFIGVSYRNISSDPSRPIIMSVFFSNVAQITRVLVSNLALALLTFYQALSLLLVLVRIVNVLSDQRRLEQIEDKNQRHAFRGVNYMAVGLLLGIVESGVGFSDGDFEDVLARRILRSLGRISLVIGVIKGFDTIEVAAAYPSPVNKQTLVDKPDANRHSSLDAAKDPEWNMIRNIRPLSLASCEIAAIYPNVQRGNRVTVHFPRERAPMLQLHLLDNERAGRQSECPESGPPTSRSPSQSPLPFLDLLFSKRTPMNSNEREDIGPTTQSQSGHHRRSKSLEDNASNNRRSDLESGTASELSCSQVPRSMSGDWSQNILSPSVWLHRRLKIRHNPEYVAQRKLVASGTLNPDFVFPPVVPGAVPLTSKWTTTSSSTSRVSPGPESHSSQELTSIDKRTISWIGPRFESEYESNPRTGSLVESRPSSYNSSASAKLIAVFPNRAFRTMNIERMISEVESIAQNEDRDGNGVEDVQSLDVSRFSTALQGEEVGQAL